jgi:hypothetical protein
MSKYSLFVLLAMLFLPGSLVAQHGSANNGYFPSAYQGDTWTGIVSNTAPSARELSLVYTHKGKTDVFEGVLSKSYRVQSNGDKEKQQIAAAGIAMGVHLKVYYVPNQTSDELGATAPFKAFGSNLFEASGDAKPRFNLIFLVEFLPEEGENVIGTVVATNDSRREISLEVADGSKTGNFVGNVVDGYRVRMKDGGFRELVVSQIPVGTKLTVHYFDEMTGPDRKSVEVHRIYRVQFLALPQTP